MTKPATGSAHHSPKSAFEQQTAEQDGRQISAEVGLAGVGGHGSTARPMLTRLFGSGQQGHRDQRSRSDHDFWQTFNATGGGNCA